MNEQQIDAQPAAELPEILNIVSATLKTTLERLQKVDTENSETRQALRTLDQAFGNLGRIVQRHELILAAATQPRTKPTGGLN